jgi:hypothetical protein
MRLRNFLEEELKNVNWPKFLKATMQQTIADLEAQADYIVKKNPATAEKEFERFVDAIKSSNLKAVSTLDIPKEMMQQVNYQIDFAVKEIKKEYGW